MNRKPKIEVNSFDNVLVHILLMYLTAYEKRIRQKENALLTSVHLPQRCIKNLQRKKFIINNSDGIAVLLREEGIKEAQRVEELLLTKAIGKSKKEDIIESLVLLLFYVNPLGSYDDAEILSPRSYNLFDVIFKMDKMRLIIFPPYQGHSYIITEIGQEYAQTMMDAYLPEIEVDRKTPDIIEVFH